MVAAFSGLCAENAFEVTPHQSQESQELATSRLAGAKSALFADFAPPKRGRPHWSPAEFQPASRAPGSGAQRLAGAPAVIIPANAPVKAGDVTGVAHEASETEAIVALGAAGVLGANVAL